MWWPKRKQETRRAELVEAQLADLFSEMRFDRGGGIRNFCQNCCGEGTLKRWAIHRDTPPAKGSHLWQPEAIRRTWLECQTCLTIFSPQELGEKRLHRRKLARRKNKGTRCRK